MKPDFSEKVLIPAATTTSPAIGIIRERKSSTMDKCIITSALIFGFVIAIVTAGFILRQEYKLNSYETRMTFLETELSEMRELWNDEMALRGASGGNPEDLQVAYRLPPHVNIFGSDENSDEYDYGSKEVHSEENEMNGEQEVSEDKMIKPRRKREAATHDTQMFGSGMDLSEEMERQRNELIQRAEAFFGRTESRGLNEWSSVQSQSQPSQRSSSSWSEREERRHHSSRSSTSSSSPSSSSSISLKSGDLGEESTNPNFSEEVTYRRTSSGSHDSNSNSNSGGASRGATATRRCVTTTTNADGSTTTVTSTNGDGTRRCGTNGALPSRLSFRNSNGAITNTNTETRSSQTSSSNSNNNQENTGFACGHSTSACRFRTVATSDSPTTHVTYHRRSRPPTSSGIMVTSTDQLNTQEQVRNLVYPRQSLQTFGRGEGEVVARVLQTGDDDEDLTQSQSRHRGHIQSGSETLSEEYSEHSEHSSSNRQGARRVAAPTPAPAPVLAPTYQQASQTTYQNRNSHSSQSQQRESTYENSGSGNINIAKAEAWIDTPGNPVAAHYIGDDANFTSSSSHRHYGASSRLQNNGGIFSAWKASNWMEASSSDEDKNFILNQNGVLTVKKPGLYYIYAQIHYLDDHDTNGFTVQVNTSPFLQCTTMTESPSGGAKSNSCFTAGITHLRENDRVLIKDTESNRYSVFKPEKSFFGLMKIGCDC